MVDISRLSSETLYLLEVSVAVAPDCAVDVDWQPHLQTSFEPATDRDFLDMLGDPRYRFFMGGVGLGKPGLVVTPYIPDSRCCGDDMLEIRRIG